MALHAIDWTATAAWVQAIGSIAAILVAVWIGKRSDERAERLVEAERQRLAKASATFVVEVLRRVRRTAVRIHTELRENMEILADRTRKHGPPHWLLKKEIYQIDLPAETDRMREMVLTFDVDVACEVTHAIEGIHRFNESLGMLDAGRPSSEQDVLDVLAEVSTHMHQLQSHLAQAANTVELAHGLRVPDFRVRN